MKKYFIRALITLKKHFTYRARVLIYIILDCSLFFIFPFLWLSVFQDKVLVGGYTKESLITYYVVAGLVTLLSSSHIGNYLFEDIRTGKLSTHLIRPVNHFLWHFFGEAGYRIISIFVALPLFALLYFLFPEYILLPSNFLSVVFFSLALFLAWVLSALFQYIVALSTFWFGETNFASHIRWFLEKIFSGELAPLPLLPLLLQKIATFLPFQYLFFFPIQIYLEKLSLADTLSQFGIFLLWILFFSLVSLLLWKRGLKRYDGSGI